MAEVLPSSPNATTDPVICSAPGQQEHDHLLGPGDQDPALSSSPVGTSLPRTSTPESSHHVRPSPFQTRDPVPPRSTPPPPVHIGNHSVAAGAPADRGTVVSAQNVSLLSGLQHVDLLQQPNNVVSPIDNSPQERPHQPGSRVKRFSYSPACDLLILKAVTTTGAHLANHGKTTVKFQETVSIMSQASSASQVEGVMSLTWKSVRDRFKKIITDRRKKNKRNLNASGIVEERGEKEVLLDDLLPEIDEHEETKRIEKEEKSGREQKLLEAGRSIRKQALNRSTNSGSSHGLDSVDEVDRENDEISASADRRKNSVKRRRVQYDSDGEDKRLMIQDMEARREAENSRLDLETKRFELEQQRDKAQREASDRLAKTEELKMRLEERKIRVEERRAEIDIEERREAIRERQRLVSVLTALPKKLSE